MVIISDLRKQDDGYDGGEILDPANGYVYSCKLRVINSGNTLLVRGYIGFSLLGRSQTWQRAQ